MLSESERGDGEKGLLRRADRRDPTPLSPKTDPVSRIILRCSDKLKDILHLK